MIIGSHVSAAGGLHKGIERAVSVGCDCIQIVTKSLTLYFPAPCRDHPLRGTVHS